MSTPSSREELKQYALRKLGAPVIEINVDDAQLEDALDDALQMFNEYHFDGTERALYKHEVTQTDIDNGFLDTDSFGFTGPSDAIQPEDSKKIVCQIITSLSHTFHFWLISLIQRNKLDLAESRIVCILIWIGQKR